MKIHRILKVGALALVLVNCADAANLFSRVAMRTQNNLRIYAMMAAGGTSALALYKSAPPVFAAAPQAPDEQLVYTFPEPGVLHKCLRGNAFTKDPWMQEKGILQAASEEFAGRESVALGIRLGVEVMLYDMAKKLGLNPRTEQVVSMNLVEGLKDCASTHKRSK